MKLLILTHYFTPDLSAGSFRMQGLVDALAAFARDGLTVDLIASRPSRYASLKADAPAQEDHGWLRIHRIDLPTHRSGMIDQAVAYVYYMRGVERLTQGRGWNLVFATSSRLMTAALGARIAGKAKAALYLDVRDLFADNLDELFAGRPTKLLLPVFRRLERYAFRRASRINVVSSGFLPHVRAIAPQAEMSVFTNGIDDLFLTEDFSRSGPAASNLPLILYAGNIGDGQGLHHVVPRAAHLLQGKARLRLIGDGGRSAELKAALAQAGTENVEVLPPVPRAMLVHHYREADVLLLHLNDLKAFRKVLPSKIFEYAATGKPLLAGVAGHAADFLSAQVPSAAIFPPLDACAMASAAERLIAGPRWVDRAAFRAAFSRRSIMRDMARDIIAAMPDQVRTRAAAE